MPPNYEISYITTSNLFKLNKIWLEYGGELNGSWPNYAHLYWIMILTSLKIINHLNNNNNNNMITSLHLLKRNHLLGVTFLNDMTSHKIIMLRC